MKSSLYLWRAALAFGAGLILLLAGCGRHDTTTIELREGDRVVFLGDTFIEREQQQGWIELMLTTRFPDHNLTFRNLGWSADTPAGASRFGLSLFQTTKTPPDEGWKGLVKQLEDAQPTVVFLGYGMASSFAGPAGLPQFRAEYIRLLTELRRISPEARLVVLGPLPHESLGMPWPDPVAHNAVLRQYDDALRTLAAERGLAFLSFIEALAPAAGTGAAVHLTDNGIHPTAAGYRRLAEIMEDRWYGSPGAWRTSAQAEPLRDAIRRKNQLFFHRSRPANMAYIFGFRKHEQGQNAVEVPRFDPLIATEEQRIAQLRKLQAGAVITDAPAPVHPLTSQPRPVLQVAPELEVTLWAETPLLEKPIHMNFDPSGRLWVATSEIYPQIQPGQPLTDKIVVLEDTTGAGRADKATVFADGLLIPTGVLPGDGGVYVAQSSELLFLRDTDGDGKADEHRTVLSSFGTEDTHHNLHTLTWGPDGWLYMNQSNNTRTHLETPYGVVRKEAGAVFRFDPRDQRIGVIFNGWINPWGHVFDRYGQSFITDGAGSSGLSWGVPGANYSSMAPTRRVLQSITPGSQPKYCGEAMIRSSHFPADWQGDVITCDFRAQRIVRFKLSDQGAGYVTQAMPDLLTSTAASFRPIDVKLGPDGALYIADWSNPIIQHGEVDFRDPRRDKEHGRIWRVAYKGRPALPHVNYALLGTPELLALLTSPEGYIQASAQRVLMERHRVSAQSEIATWVRAQTDDYARLAALRLQQALGAPDDGLASALLTSADPDIRAAAVRALPESAPLAQLAQLVTDRHARVRLEAVRALGRRPSPDAAALALGALDQPMDPFLDYALWLTLNELAPAWMPAAEAGDWTALLSDAQLEFAFRALEPAQAGPLLSHLLAAHPLTRAGTGPWIEFIGSAGLPAELRLLFDQVNEDKFEPAAAVRALRALADAARLRQIRPAGDLSGLARLVEKNGPERIVALRLAGAWQLIALAPHVAAVATQSGITPEERSAAFEALRAMGGDWVRAELVRIAMGPDPAPVRRDAVVALARLDFKAALSHVVALLAATIDEEEAAALWRNLLSIQGAEAALTAALAQAELPVLVAGAGVRPAREAAPDSGLVPRLLQLAGMSLSVKPLTAEEIAVMAQEAMTKGDPVRGEHIFRRPELACVSCHAIGGIGGHVGPDLTSIGGSAQPDYLLESLIYPNLRTKEGYVAVQITTRDQQVLNGMIVREDAQELALRSVTNEVVSIPVANIAERRDIGSLMPAGLIDGLLPEERMDLVRFLAALGKLPDFNAARNNVARFWRTYRVDSENQAVGVEGVVKGDFTLADWQPAPTFVNGWLAKEIVLGSGSARRGGSRGIFAAVRFTPHQPGPVAFTLEGGAGNVWLNGEPIKAGAQFTAEARPDTNVLVFQLTTANQPREIRLSSDQVSFLAE